jgi:hypothetical protein
VGEPFDSAQTDHQRPGELAPATAAETLPDRLIEAMAGYVQAARADNTWRPTTPTSGTLPVGAENPVTSCDLGIFMDQAAEPVPA